MNRIDLTLEASDNDSMPIRVFLNSPISSDGFATQIPAELLQLLNVWRRRFLSHHDPHGTSIEAGIVAERSSELCHALQAWLLQPEWLALQRLLALQPDVPLRIRCRPASSALARLPWDSLSLQRPIWRLASATAPIAAPGERPIRRPRLLLLIGDDHGLDLTAEVDQLQALARQGGLELICLRGAQSCLPELARQLRDRRGWDGLIYLGHSDADSRGGGRLQLGDGRWLSGLELRRELEQITDPRCRPSFVLLNSCLGLDLADSCLAAGIPWVVCFREMVPSHGASHAFGVLLQQLQAGLDLAAAVAVVRRTLQDQGPVGTALLLSVVCADSAQPLRLPLSRGQQFRRRLATSSRAQAAAAAACLSIGLAMDLNPSLPPGPALLDQRLDWQRTWRQISQQPGPQRPPLPVLLIDKGPIAAALGVSPAAAPNRVPRQLLVKLLERVSPAAVPVVGLDVVLDEPAPFTTQLAELLRRQRRQQVLAGYLNTQAAAAGTGQQRSLPVLELRQSGLQARDLNTGIAAPQGAGGKQSILPLRIVDRLGEDTFAWAIATASQPRKPSQPLPYEAVIDWSLDWSRLIQLLELPQLATLRGPVLLVGTDGTSDPDDPDLFMAPRVFRSPSLVRWELPAGRLPGPILQAVLAQSMAMGHWLTPQLGTPTTALGAGLGVLLAAAVSRRRRRWLPLLTIGGATLPLSLQLAVHQGILIPIALPLVACASTALIRHD